VPDLENYGTEPPAAPADGTELLRVLALLVNQICLIKDLLRFFQTDAMFFLD
jgi:hypothetical protein